MARATPGNRKVPDKADLSCPHLGLADDPWRHEAEPSPDHRCYLWMQRDRIDLSHQANFCLTASHEICPWLTISTPSPVRPTTPGARLRRAGLIALARTAALLSVAAKALWVALLAVVAAAGPFIARVATAAWRRLRPRAAALAHYLAARALRARPEGTSTRAWLRRNIFAQRPAAATGPGPAETAAAGERPLAPLVVSVPADAASHETAPVAGAPPAAAEGTPADLVAQGILALRERGREVAYALFVQASEMSETVEEAWLWRAALAASLEEKRSCLQQVVLLNPESARAKAALAQLAGAGAPPAASADSAQHSVGHLSGRVGVTSWQCDACMNTNLTASRACRVCGNPSPEVEQELRASGDGLLEEGLIALKARAEDVAHDCFVAACQASPRSELAWYWRAKTAETLDELLASLEQVVAINPGNFNASAELASARQRREHEQVLAPAPVPATGKTAARRPGLARRFWLLGVRPSMPAMAAVAAFLLCLFWLAPAIMAQAGGLLPLQDIRPYTPLLTLPQLPIHTGWPLLPDLDASRAIPYAMAALCFYAAYQIPDRRPGSNFWGIAVALLSAGLAITRVTNEAAVALALILSGTTIAAELLGWREFGAPQGAPARGAETGRGRIDALR